MLKYTNQELCSGFDEDDSVLFSIYITGEVGSRIIPIKSMTTIKVLNDYVSPVNEPGEDFCNKWKVWGPEILQ